VQLPAKTFLMVVRIMVITIVISIGAMGFASVSASYVRDTANAQSVPQLAAVHQSSSWLKSSVNPLPAVPTLVNVPSLARPARKNASFPGLPVRSIGGTQPQVSGTPEPAEVDMTETAEPVEVDDTQEEQVTRTPVVEFDEETNSSNNDDQNEHMSGTPSPEQDDENSESNSDNQDTQQQNNQVHNHSSHSGHHNDGGNQGGGGD